MMLQRWVAALYLIQMSFKFSPNTLQSTFVLLCKQDVFIPPFRTKFKTSFFIYSIGIPPCTPQARSDTVSNSYHHLHMSMKFPTRILVWVVYKLWFDSTWLYYVLHVRSATLVDGFWTRSELILKSCLKFSHFVLQCGLHENHSGRVFMWVFFFFFVVVLFCCFFCLFVLHICVSKYPQNNATHRWIMMYRGSKRGFCLFFFIWGGGGNDEIQNVSMNVGWMLVVLLEIKANREIHNLSGVLAKGMLLKSPRNMVSSLNALFRVIPGVVQQILL